MGKEAEELVFCIEHGFYFFIKIAKNIYIF